MNRIMKCAAAAVCLTLFGAPSSSRGEIRDMPLVKPAVRTSRVLHQAFSARKDQFLIAASLSIEFAPIVPEGLSAARLSLNGETIEELDLSRIAGEKRSWTLPAEQLAAENLLAVHLVPSAADVPGFCVPLPEDSWNVIRSGLLAIESTPLPLPNDLSILPLPFIDPIVDRSATIGLSLPVPDDATYIRLAGLLAGWLGVQTGVDLRFRVAVGALSTGDTIALSASAADSASLGLPAPTGPTVSMIAHPVDLEKKVLLLSGRSTDELEQAVRGFVGNRLALRGPELTYERPFSLPLMQAYGASRWVREGTPVLLGSLPMQQTLEHKGASDAVISVSFRLPPDLWTWPTETIVLDLGYEVVGVGEERPRLDLEFNGKFLATLPDVPPSATRARARIGIHSFRIRSFNHLALYVSFPNRASACDADVGPNEAAGPPARVAILPDSALHVEALPHFSLNPDVGLFVDDGWPFTRFADLSETDILLPKKPAAEELGTLFSLLAHMGEITGSAPWGARYIAESQLEQSRRDVLVVAGIARLPLPPAEAERLPFRVVEGNLKLRPLEVPALVRDAFRLFTASRAEARLASFIDRPNVELSGVFGFTREREGERAMIGVFGTNAESMPSASDLVGATEGRRQGDNLLVRVTSESEEARAAGRLSPTHGFGVLPRWTYFRWLVSEVPLAMAMMLCLSSFLIALHARLTVRAMSARRLGLTRKVQHD